MQYLNKSVTTTYSKVYTYSSAYMLFTCKSQKGTTPLLSQKMVKIYYLTFTILRHKIK